MNLQEIEAVARAFYEIQEDGWDRAPEWCKVKFCEEARAAVAALNEHARHIRALRSAQPLSFHAAEPDRDPLFVPADKRRKH
ncbi:hypothetical protein AA309_11355 [Microvirga vignae]|uniref:Uncharacterized protein n=1 Tax=Microvirga vignae TaxID=1225564 RepID=A0A0H1RDQ0_9HYPH|nr:hypothetical protein AA309_11355 [Microvirga vignae]